MARPLIRMIDVRRLAADLAISAPWPRDETVRSTPECVEECRQVSPTLKDAGPERRWP